MIRARQLLLPTIPFTIVAQITAFDSKEFKIPGKVRDFFSLIGIGLEIRDHSSFKEAYCNLMLSEAKRMNLPLKRSVFDSYTLTRILGGQDAFLNFFERVVTDIKAHLEKVYLFYMIIPPRKIPRLFVYDEQTEIKDPIDFLHEHKAGFVVLCGWKYSEMVSNQNRTSSLCLDYFETKHTKAWESLKNLHPRLFIRGDTCNPCIAAADGLLAVIDRQLKRNLYIDGEKLCDMSVRHALKDLGLSGDPVFIGQPDLRKIIPDSRDQVLTRDFISHPIFFICPEKRPEGMTAQEYREMIEYTPIMDKLVENACTCDGSIKFYDATTDYLLAKKGDYFAYFGKRGREMFETLAYHFQIHPLNLSPQLTGNDSKQL